MVFLFRNYRLGTDGFSAVGFGGTIELSLAILRRTSARRYAARVTFFSESLRASAAYPSGNSRNLS